MIACGKVYPGCTDKQESSFETMTNLHIDAVRLMSRIDALGAIGVTPEGGVRRLTLSDEDRAARIHLRA